MTLEQAILEKVRSRPLEKQQAILDFAEFLLQKSPMQASVQPEPSPAQFYGMEEKSVFLAGI